MFVCSFVYSDLRVEILFRKERAPEKGGVDFEIGDWGTSVNLYCEWKKFHKIFWWQKRIVFKNYIYVHILIIELFYLSSYILESRERYREAAVDVYRRGDILEVVLPGETNNLIWGGGAWEWLGGKRNYKMSFFKNIFQRFC